MNESMPSDPKCPQLPYSIERRQVYLEIMQRNVVDRIHDSFSRGDETNVLKLISSILEIPKAFRNTPFYLSLLVYVLRSNIAFQSINRLTDNDGKCPLHIALEDTNHNFDLITFLVDACPSALTLVTSSGDTAIHIACQHHNLSHEIINLLAKSHPPALRVFNNNKMLPIHILCNPYMLHNDRLRVAEVSNAPTFFKILKCFVMNYPQSLHIEVHEVRTHLSLSRIDGADGPSSSSVVTNIDQKWTPFSCLCNSKFKDRCKHPNDFAFENVEDAIESIITQYGLLILNCYKK